MRNAWALVFSLLLALPASAQQCPDRPPDFRPHERVVHPVATHCFAGPRLVAFHRADTPIDEGSGPSSFPDVILAEHDGRLVERFRSEEPRATRRTRGR